MFVSLCLFQVQWPLFHVKLDRKVCKDCCVDKLLHSTSCERSAPRLFFFCVHCVDHVAFSTNHWGDLAHSAAASRGGLQPPSRWASARHRVHALFGLTRASVLAKAGRLCSFSAWWPKCMRIWLSLPLAVCSPSGSSRPCVGGVGASGLAEAPESTSPPSTGRQRPNRCSRALVGRPCSTDGCQLGGAPASLIAYVLTEATVG